MKGDAAMILGIIVGVLLMGLFGLIWVMVLDILCDDAHSYDKQPGSASSEPRDGYELLNALSGSQRPQPYKGT